MYGFNQIVALFTATRAAATTTYPKRLFRLNPQLRSISFTHSSRRRVVDPPSATATAGVDDDFVNVGEGDKIPGGDNEVLPENESGSNDSNTTYVRRMLPPELSRSAVMLTCESSAEGGICDVYLVGTVHVSKESCKEVQAVIEFLKPQVVYLELCSSREAILTHQNLKVPTKAKMVDMWKKNHNLFGILYSLFLAKVANKLGVLPGAEFRVGYEEAMKYGGKVILGDRPVQITLRRTWAAMPRWHKTKLLYSLLFQTLFLTSPKDITKTLKDLDDVDMVNLVIQEMSKTFPTLMETLVHERDQYMSATLLRVACQHNSVVAVLGKGHLPGIQKHWEQPVDVKQLLSMPSEKKRIPVGKILTSIGALVAGVAILKNLSII